MMSFTTNMTSTSLVITFPKQEIFIYCLLWVQQDGSLALGCGHPLTPMLMVTIQFMIYANSVFQQSSVKR